ncbi:uncharacterized protein LOC132705269 [Cylas formicarius]|uniref:uncharacterized protein LOC132705269 n=1 Tax=Cylas formicarius TaxID=197179 RepID=UPI002958B72E|nr:uncharacterized protein LOC132705269 [Cylas formicarius]XP_060531742.1 uncharacterized protein LOC132705269 [Cylas formicarius]
MTKWRKCCLCDKREDTEVNGEIISFHSFPTNQDKRNIWLNLIGIESMPRKTLMLCSDHFDPSHFFYTNRGSRKLRPDATPKPTCASSTSSNTNNSMGLLPAATIESTEYTQIKIESNDTSDITIEYNKLIPIAGGHDIPMDFPSFVKVEKDQPDSPQYDKVKVEVEDMDFRSCATNLGIKVECDQTDYVKKIKVEADLWPDSNLIEMSDDAHAGGSLGSDPNEGTKIKVDEDEIPRFVIDNNQTSDGLDICSGSGKEPSKLREENVASNLDRMYHIPKLTGIEIDKLRPDDFQDPGLAEYYLTSMNAELNRNTDEIQVLEGVVKSLRLKVKSLLSLRRELKEKTLIKEKKGAALKASFRNAYRRKLKQQKIDALLDDICTSDDRIELVKE